MQNRHPRPQVRRRANHLHLGPLRRQRAWLARPDDGHHNLARWTARIGPFGERIATTKTLRRRFTSPWPRRITRSARRLTNCIFRIAGLGLRSSAAPWPGCEPFRSAGLTAPSATDPPTGQHKSLRRSHRQPDTREMPWTAIPSAMDGASPMLPQTTIGAPCRQSEPDRPPTGASSSGKCEAHAISQLALRSSTAITLSSPPSIGVLGGTRG